VKFVVRDIFNLVLFTKLNTSEVSESLIIHTHTNWNWSWKAYWVW